MELDGLGLYDIHSLYHVPFWHTMWFTYCLLACGALCSVLFVTFIAWLLERRRCVPQMSPWKRALYALDHVHKNYDALTQIVKEYIATRYKFDLWIKTDQEVCAYLENKSLDFATKHICMVLRNGITAKFARTVTTQKQLDDDYQHVKQFILHTVPQKKNGTTVLS